MNITLTVTEDEFEIISSALNYRAGTLIVEAMQNPSVMAQMEAINDLGARLDDQVSEQE